MRLRRLTAAAGAILAGLLAACRSDPVRPTLNDAADLLITNTTVVGGRDHSVQEAVDVWVRGGHITAVRTHPSAGEARQVIDGAGKFVVPGYIDGHTHPFPVERSFPQFTHYGVTSILVTGCSLCSDETLSALRVQGNDAAQPAPRVFHTSQHFTMEGRHPVKTYPSPNWVEGRSVFYLRDVEGIATLVARVAQQPIVGIKLTIEEGPAPPFVERVPQAFVNEVVAQAHAQGLKVYVHVSDMQELAMAVEAGVDHLLHFTGVEIDWARHGDMIQSLVDREVHWVTTLMIDKSFIYPLRPEWIDTARASGLFDRELSLAANFGMSPEAARRNAELVYGEPDPDFATNPILVKQFEDLRRLHALGIDLVVGTDVGNRYILPGYSLHEEMALLEQAGFGPVDVLKMATINAAELVGAAERLGSVEPGKLADLVLLNSDPRETVANLSDIHAVLKAGNKIR